MEETASVRCKKVDLLESTNSLQSTIVGQNLLLISIDLLVINVFITLIFDRC